MCYFVLDCREKTAYEKEYIKKKMNTVQNISPSSLRLMHTTRCNNTQYNCHERVQQHIKKNIQKNLKQSLLPEFWKKRSKTHKRLNGCFLTGRNRTNRANFRGSYLFEATYNIKIENQTIQPILCQLDVGGWWKEEGMRLTVVQLKTVLLISRVFWT